MNGPQQLGGTRQSTPLEDEMSYPLTSEEFLLIKENISINKFTNWDSFLLTTGITSLISGFVIGLTGSFEKHTIVGGKDVTSINNLEIILLIVYGAITLGSFIGFIVSQVLKNKSKNPVQRLDNKITNHLNPVSK